MQKEHFNMVLLQQTCCFSSSVISHQLLQEEFSFEIGKYNSVSHGSAAAVFLVYAGCKAADYPHKLCPKHAFLRGLPPPLEKFWNVGSLRADLQAISTSQLVRAIISCVCSQMHIPACKLHHQDH